MMKKTSLTTDQVSLSGGGAGACVGRSAVGAGACGTGTAVTTYLNNGDGAGIGGGMVGERKTDGGVGGKSERVRCERGLC